MIDFWPWLSKRNSCLLKIFKSCAWTIGARNVYDTIIHHLSIHHCWQQKFKFLIKNKIIFEYFKNIVWIYLCGFIYLKFNDLYRADIFRIVFHQFLIQINNKHDVFPLWVPFSSFSTVFSDIDNLPYLDSKQLPYTKSRSQLIQIDQVSYNLQAIK